MSRVRMVVDVDDLRVEPLGVKEAVTMTLEFLGGVRVLSVEVQEPEQLRVAGGAFAPPKPAPKPGPKAPPPASSGQAPARRTPKPHTALECCFSCGCFRSRRGQDPGGNLYWGTCGRSGRLVHDVTKGCKGWVRLGG